ncbi:hypothetical protein OE647_10040 [Defluviimonas sp. WL0075]|uniref:Uncharacterized protein n=1 Tax=Albidovulum sediminicola TaxID=2984331 RepID=A0ABT2Z1Q6_9RHOB|nr:hypothetical protein [Defluviimonas sp. WL0075]MCV2865074.1 hypothetical protein [Defluviimonas sp. WL0075]
MSIWVPSRAQVSESSTWAQQGRRSPASARKAGSCALPPTRLTELPMSRAGNCPFSKWSGARQIRWSVIEINSVRMKAEMFCACVSVTGCAVRAPPPSTAAIPVWNGATAAARWVTIPDPSLVALRLAKRAHHPPQKPTTNRRADHAPESGNLAAVAYPIAAAKDDDARPVGAQAGRYAGLGPLEAHQHVCPQLGYARDPGAAVSDAQHAGDAAKLHLGPGLRHDAGHAVQRSREHVARQRGAFRRHRPPGWPW